MEELRHLRTHALGDHVPGVWIALEYGLRHGSDLVEAGMRRNRRDVRVASYVEHHRPTGVQGALPGRAEVLGLVDFDSVNPETSGESGVRNVGNDLRLLELRGAAHRAELPRHLVEVVVVEDADDASRIVPLLPV